MEPAEEESQKYESLCTTSVVSIYEYSYTSTRLIARWMRSKQYANLRRERKCSSTADAVLLYEVHEVAM